MPPHLRAVVKVHFEQINALKTQKYKEILHLVNTELILRFEICRSASNVTEGQAESVGRHDAGRHPWAPSCMSQGLDVWSPAVRTSVKGEVFDAYEVGPEAQLPACAPVRVPPSPAWRALDRRGQPFRDVRCSSACWLRLAYPQGWTVGCPLSVQQHTQSRPAGLTCSG